MSETPKIVGANGQQVPSSQPVSPSQPDAQKAASASGEAGTETVRVEKPFQMGFVDQLGTFVVEIKLHRVQPAMALGLLVQATDIVKTWYNEVARERVALKQANMNRQQKGLLAKLGKFIPKI